jgi:hypothetical protein
MIDMKNAILIFVVSSLVGVFLLNAVFEVVFLAASIAMLYYVVRKNLREKAELKYYSELYEPLFVVELPDGTAGLELEKIGMGHLERHIVYAAKGEVNRTANLIKDRILRSGNQRGVRVSVIRFRDGAFYAELESEYRERVAAMVKKSLVEVHQYLKELAPDWYEEVYHGEKEKFVWNI